MLERQIEELKRSHGRVPKIHRVVLTGGPCAGMHLHPPLSPLVLFYHLRTLLTPLPAPFQLAASSCTVSHRICHNCPPAIGLVPTGSLGEHTLIVLALRQNNSAQQAARVLPEPWLLGADHGRGAPLAREM